MMTKRLFFSAISLLMVAVLWAVPRTPEQALEIARATRWRVAPAHHILTRQSAYIAAHSHAYYAVNTGNGFVLVSADSNMPEILGYSDGSEFCTDSLPFAFRFWLECYDDEALDLDTIAASTFDRSFSDAQPPLLTCKWNQSSPFNDSVPAYNATKRAAAGCVATAMAQIMYAYKHPTRGTGSHTYQWTSKRDPSLSAILQADFGATTYHWNAMLDSYSGATSVDPRSAVATLLYHCGVAVDMGYDCNASHESGAVTGKVPQALSTYFGYDPHYQFIRKDIYPIDSLNAIIRAELQQQRPVLVSGSNDQGGHAFVCDGYNRNGYFHINWGWGGKSDGYFLLSALNPGQQGIGGTTKGYNKNTTFYIGLQPQSTTSVRYPSQLAADSFTISTSLLTRDASFSTAVYHIQNYGMDDYSGSCGVALYDEDETTIVALLKSSSFSLKSNYYRTSEVSTTGIKIPASVEDGTYHLCLVYKDADYGWLRMLNRCDDYYKTVYVSTDSIIFIDNHAPAELSLTEPISFADNAYSIPRTGLPLSFSIHNTGGTFHGEISARIYQGNFAKGQYEVLDSVAIRRNQTFSSALQQVFDNKLATDKTYKMKLCWRADAFDSWHEFAPSEYGIVTFTICESEDNPLTSVADIGMCGENIISRRFIMHLPVGDLYLVATRNSDNSVKQHKILIHK